MSPRDRRGMATASPYHYPPARPAAETWRAQDSKVTPLDHAGSLALLAVVFSGFIAAVGDLSRLVIVVGSMSVLAVLAIIRNAGRTSQWALTAFAICLVWYGLSSYYDQTFRLDMNYYVAPIVALGAFNIRPKILTAYILGAMCVQVAVQLYEWLTGSFIYYAVGKYDDELLDEEAFEGAAGVFRSKGMFEGATIMGGTLVYFSVVTRLQPVVVLLCIFCCFLGYARLGLVLTALLFLIYLISSFKPQRVLTLGVVALVAATAGYYVFSLVTGGDFNFEFIYSTFDTASSQNDTRIDYWLRGVDFIWSMNGAELIFGAASRYFLEIGNSAENAWVNILALAGLPMLLVYLVTCFRFARDNRFALAVQGVIFLSGMIAANFQSLATCILFWLAALVAIRPITGSERRVVAEEEELEEEAEDAPGDEAPPPDAPLPAGGRG
jgi:hypothetical protein